MVILVGQWVRRCQECWHLQKDTKPALNTEATAAYDNRVCRKCKSPGLDYGTEYDTEMEIE